VSWFLFYSFSIHPIMSAIPPNHWDERDGNLASRVANLNVNAPVFVPNVNAPSFVPSGVFQNTQKEIGTVTK